MTCPWLLVVNFAGSYSATLHAQNHFSIRDHFNGRCSCWGCVAVIPRAGFESFYRFRDCLVDGLFFAITTYSSPEE